MTLREFKAWLDGYEESFGYSHAPSTDQWAKVKERLATVEEPALSLQGKTYRDTRPTYAQPGITTCIYEAATS